MKSSPLLGLLKYRKCQDLSTTLTVNAWAVACVLFPFSLEIHQMPDSSDSLECIYEAKNPSHKLCCCTRKCSGNACIMWNNLTYASFSCERRQAVRFTPCPRWPAMESSQIARLPLCCINNSISEGAWTALSQLCSQVKMQTDKKNHKPRRKFTSWSATQSRLIIKHFTWLSAVAMENVCRYARHSLMVWP